MVYGTFCKQLEQEKTKVMSDKYTCITLSDASEQQTIQSWLPLEVKQLSRGEYQGNMRLIENNSVTICAEQQNVMVHKVGVIDDDYCTLSFALASKTAIRFSEYTPANNALFWLPSKTEFDVQVPAGAETVYFRFKQSTLLERARAFCPEQWDNDRLQMCHSLKQPALDVYTRYLLSAKSFQTGDSPEQMDAEASLSLMDKLIVAIYQASDDDFDFVNSHSLRLAKTWVYMAIDYINAALMQHVCPSIVDICIELKVSQRKLQYSFKKILGITPQNYLYKYRLNKVRAELLKSCCTLVTVTEVALYWHFWHLGRFSKDYQHLFGELPSATLKRAVPNSLGG